MLPFPISKEKQTGMDTAPLELRLVLLIALFVVGILLLRNARFHNPGELIKGLKPGVAMEFVRSQDEGRTLLGPISSQDGDYNRAVMRRQQYLDFVFIPLYVLFLASFAAFVAPTWLRSSAAMAIVLAGVFDYLEDFSILRACNGDTRQKLFPITFGTPKWIFFFLTLALLAYALIERHISPFAPPGISSRALAWVVGTLFALSAVLGILGVLLVLRSRYGQVLNVGTLISFAAFFAILVFLLTRLLRFRTRPL